MDSTYGIRKKIAVFSLSLLAFCACKDKAKEADIDERKTIPTVAEQASLDLFSAAKNYHEATAGCTTDAGLRSIASKIIETKGTILTQAMIQDANSLRTKAAPAKATGVSALYPDLSTIFVAAADAAANTDTSQVKENSGLQDASQIQAQICVTAKAELFNSIKKITLP